MRHRRQMQLVLALVLGTAVLIAAFVVFRSPTKHTHAPGGLRGSQIPAALVRQAAPAFRLRDGRTGAMVDSRSLTGRPYAITFLYTECPDVCPLIGQELRQALQDLGPQSRDVNVIAISVDPRGDTPSAVRAWLHHQGQPSNFHYLIGTTSELSPIWAKYFVAPQISGDPATSTHTATVWLVDRHGHRRTDYAGGSSIDPANVAHDLRLLLQET